MKYTIRGRLLQNSREYTITWEDGKLQADQIPLHITEFYGKQLEGRPVGPVTGPFTISEHLKDPISAFVLIQEYVFQGGVIDVTGELPELPEIPPGAKA